ncbi:MAG: hypothetical protein U0768_00450 [Anaerolineae bacterium]
MEPQPTPVHHEADERWRDMVMASSEDDRLERLLEIVSAILLGLATVATAWCGYQTSKWNGQQDQYYIDATTLRIEATEATNNANRAATIQVNMFLQYAQAVSTQNQQLADFLYKRFPPALKTATDAWLATKPLQNPDAPSSPFVMPEYVLDEQQKATELSTEADQKLQLANGASAVGDQYTLLTVMFASVLFVAGIATRFKWHVVDMSVTIIATVLFLVSLWYVLKLPILT